MVVACYVWAAIGAAIGLATWSHGDGAILRVAAIGGPALAVGAALLARSGRVRLAGAVLVLSAVATPTFFFYVVNLVFLVAGLALIIVGAPQRRRSLPAL